LIFTALISIVFAQMINYAGNSQMYFMMAAYLPMAVLGIYALSRFQKRKSPFIQKVPLVISFLILTVQAYFFIFSAWGGYSAAKSLKQGFENISGKSA
jgi:peptidoglycan/LPS O-acetylase OafA/YrhL